MVGPQRNGPSRPHKKLRIVKHAAEPTKTGVSSTGVSHEKQHRDPTSRPKFSMKVNGATQRPGILKSSKASYQSKQNAKPRQKEPDPSSESEKEEGEGGESARYNPPVFTVAPKKPPPTNLPRSFKIVAGSYEKLLYGLHGTIGVASTLSTNANPAQGSTTTESRPSYPYTIVLTPIFIFPAHVSCIKAVAASPSGGKWLATGSADEIIKVWDLRRRKEIGGLMHHEGSITHLTFPSRSHLLSASEDGSLCLFRARDWSVLRALKGHKARVNAIAVHPSGKVALSVGRDRTLRMWDLMRGKGRASTKLRKEGEIVRWSIDGSFFAVQTGSTIDIYDTNMELLHTINHPSRLHDILFCKRVLGEGEVLLAAAEDKNLSVYDVSLPSGREAKPKIIALMKGHTNRVKAVQTLEVELPTLPLTSSLSHTGRTETTIVCTVSSDGKIHVYDMAMVPAAMPDDHINTGKELDTEPPEISPVAVYDSNGTRLTCVTLADGDEENGEGEKQEPQQVGKKRRRSGEDEPVGRTSNSTNARHVDEIDDDEKAWPSEAEESEAEIELEQNEDEE